MDVHDRLIQALTDGSLYDHPITAIEVLNAHLMGGADRPLRLQNGFRPEAMMPVYGLAETSLALTFPPPGRGPRVDRIKREPFMRTGQAVPADQDDPYALRFVGCGQP
jgi:hypothetical protein